MSAATLYEQTLTLAAVFARFSRRRATTPASAVICEGMLAPVHPAPELNR